MNNVEKAVSCYMEGFVCSQAILSTYGTQFELFRNDALKLAAPFGGGIARLGLTCGAVSGALMVIGLKYGYTSVKERKKKEKMYELSRTFIDEFKSRNNSINCKELLNCDISSPEGLQKAYDEKLFIDICPKFVRESAEILEKILKENP